MSRIFEVVQSMSGQGNSITIPCPYLDYFAGDQQAHLLAAILNQLVFWSGKSHQDNGWFYKSHEDLAKEIHGVTKDQVRKAVGKLCNQYFPGVITAATRKVGGTPKKHYQIDGEALITLIFAGILETAELPHGNGNTATSFLYTDLKNTDLKDKQIFLSGNSGESPNEDKLADFKSRHPDAEIFTPSGKSWGTKRDLGCATWLFEQIKILNPTAKQPKWVEWANDVRLMRQLDGRTYKGIVALFDRVGRDEFWRKNILSPAKLRAKWDDLIIKLGDQQNACNTGESTAVQQIRAERARWERERTGSDVAVVGVDGADLREPLDCEEWKQADPALDHPDWEYDQRPDDERL